jgi:hypothetical protein
MSVIATGFERAAAPRQCDRANDTRQVLRALLSMLDRLVAPPNGNGDAELPDAWFKYPPV